MQITFLEIKNFKSIKNLRIKNVENCLILVGKNNTGKTINYYTVTFHFYNAVGDEAFSDITRKATKNIKMVGPVKPGEDLIVFSIVDYVPVCSKVQIDEIKLEYADGTVEYGWYGWYTTTENSWLK